MTTPRASRLNPPSTQEQVSAWVNARISTPMEYFAIGDGTTDDTTALQNALAGVPNGGDLHLPKGKIFKYTGTLTVPDGVVVYAGGRAFSGSGPTGYPNLLAAHANALVRVGSYGSVENLMIDCNAVANWGLLAGPGAKAKPTMSSVFVHNAVQKGFVFDAAQNAVLTDCTANDCRIGYAFYNGCCNIDLFGCTEANFGDVGGTAHRSILVDNDTTDARLGGVVFAGSAGGNRDIRFWGGIYEYGTATTQVDILNGNSFGSIQFDGTQLVGGTSGTIINVASGYTGDVVIRDATFALGGGTTMKIVTAAAGRIKYKNLTVTGTGGRNVPTMTTLTGTATVSYDFDSAMLIESRFQTGLYASPAIGWVGNGSGTATWNATKKRMAISSPDNAGDDALTYFAGYLYHAAQYRAIRVKFLVFNASANVRLSTVITGSPFRRNVGAYGNGEHEVVIELTGDEQGLALSSDTGSTVTAEIAYLTAEHLA